VLDSKKRELIKQKYPNSSLVISSCINLDEISLRKGKSGPLLYNSNKENLIGYANNIT